MPPTYNDNFRQATKKVTKKQPGAARSLEDSVIEFSFSFKPRSGERCTCPYYTTLAMSHSVDFTTFYEPWQTITLNSNAKVGNTNYHTTQNRWRYLQGRQFIEIELNVGRADGSQVGIGSQFIFADISQAPFLKNGWVRIIATGQSSALGTFEFNKVSGQANNIRYVPVTGATSYLACHEIIPNPSA